MVRIVLMLWLLMCGLAVAQESPPKQAPILRETVDDAVWGAALWTQEMVQKGGGFVAPLDFRFFSLQGLPIEDVRINAEGEPETYSPVDETARMLVWVVNQCNLFNPPATMIRISDTLYAMPLSSPGWSPEAWEALATKNTYFQRDFTSVTNWDYLCAATGSAYPIMRADQFIELGSLAPDYYNLLFGVGKVTTLAEFETLMGVQEDLLAKTMRVKAGVKVNGLTVTQHNRRLERRGGVFWVWTSQDTLSDKADGNVLKRLGFIEGEEHKLKIAGQERIFELGWGGFGGILHNAEGQRIDEVPIQIASGEDHFKDRRVRAGRSCFGCHTSAVIPFQSDLQQLLGQQIIQLSTIEPGSAIKLSAAYDEYTVQRHIKSDQTNYEDAVTRLLGINGEDTSAQFRATWKRYHEDPVTLETAAREMGRTPDQATAILIPAINPNLLWLLSKDAKGHPGSISREAWEDAFPDAMGLMGRPSEPLGHPKLENLQKKENPVKQPEKLTVSKPQPGSAVDVVLSLGGALDPASIKYISDKMDLVTVKGPSKTATGWSYPVQLKTGEDGAFPSFIEFKAGDKSLLRLPIETK